MPDVYTVAMRFAVEDQATAAIVSLAREVAKLGDAAMDAANKLENLGRSTAAAFESIKAVALYFGAGSAAIGAGILGGVDLLANKYEGLAENLEKFTKAGWDSVAVQ